METQLDRIEAKLDELLKSKKKTRQLKIPETRTLEEQLEPFRGSHPPREIEKFISYWGEGNLWKKQKTWEIDKRLKRWMMNVEDRNWQQSQRQSLKTVDEKPVERERVNNSYEGMSAVAKLVDAFKGGRYGN